jgi:hypothetical protein
VLFKEATLTRPVHLTSIHDGANFQIDLAAFPEPEPVFASWVR